MAELREEPYHAITVAQANEVLTFIDWVRPHMHLEHYQILLRSGQKHRDTNGGEARAGLDHTDNRPIGVLTVTASMFMESDDEVRRHDIVHELLHAAHTRLSQTVYSCLYQFETQVGEDKLAFAREMVRNAFEWWTDESAYWLVGLLPVPWPSPEEAADHAEWRGWDLAWHNDWDLSI